MVRRVLIDPAREDAVAADWRSRIGIRTPQMRQQHPVAVGWQPAEALFARALDSKAGLVLMDDPMRGVDVGTKQEVYAIVRAEAAKGRTFIWYTTEMAELTNCDHTYVFRNGRIVADLASSEATEERVLHSSFEEEA